MPTKRNRAGKMQNYVEAGHGDASGEYGDNATGSNKHFQVFKKPDTPSEQQSNLSYDEFKEDVEGFNQRPNDMYRSFLTEKLEKLYDEGKLNDDEITELYNLVESKWEEIQKANKEKEQQDYSNFYKGKGKETLNEQLSNILMGSNGRVTPNGKKLLEQVNNADDEMSGVIGDFYKHNRDVGINIGKNLNSAYTRSEFRGMIVSKRINLGAEAIGVGDSAGSYAKGGAFFHESGHALDYTYKNDAQQCWSFSYKSQKYGKTMSDMITEEIKANIDYDAIKKEYDEAKESYNTPEYQALEKEYKTIQDEIYEAGHNVFNNPELKAKQNEIYSLSREMKDYYKQGKFENVIDLQNQIREKNKQIDEFEKSLYPSDYQNKKDRAKALKDEMYKRKLDAYSNANVTYGDISDMLQASLGKKLGMGHSRDYFNMEADNKGTEAFAEIMSAKSVNPKSLEVMKKYIPKTLEIFDEIITKVKKGESE